MCTVQRTMEPGVGTLPPLSPVPEPRVTTGILWDDAQRSTSATCWVERGKTTASGEQWRAAVPSNP